MQPKFPLFLGLAALGLAITAAGCAHHQHHGHHGGGVEGNGLTVVGSGEAKGKPDIARSSIGIEVRAETSEQANAQANAQMTAVLGAIKAAGIPDADLRTHDFSVSFERDYTPPVPVPAPVPPPVKPGAKSAPAATVEAVAVPSTPRGSYRVSNTVEVTFRDITKVSAVLSAATAAGANNVWGINFDVENPEPLHEKARELAIAKAKHNAEQLAKLTGVKLGAIVTIEDQADSGQIAPRMFKTAMMAESADSQVPVESGELTITHQVRLVYELDKH